MQRQAELGSRPLTVRSNADVAAPCLNGVGELVSDQSQVTADIQFSIIFARTIEFVSISKDDAPSPSHR